jgi:hypothetical protein
MKRVAIVVALFAALAASSVALAATTLSGTYKTTIPSGTYKGTWKVKFTNGTYNVTDNGQAIVSGHYTITGNKISLKDKTGVGNCPGTGVYRFKITGSKVKFTKVSDPNPKCAGRVAVLKHTFTKVSS